MARLIEPRVATAIARRIAGDNSHASSDALQSLRRDLDVAVPRSEELVGEAAGIARPSPVRWSVISRAQWAEANIGSMEKMIQPLADKVGTRLDTLPFPVRLAQRTIVSVEMGVLLGYISRRVLGQYDLLVPDEAATARIRRRHPTGGAPLYFVGVNMVETQRKLGFIPQEFALWVALHEVTHRFQFAGVPWLKDRFFGLVQSYLSSMDMDGRTLSKRITSAAKRLRSGEIPREERNPVYLLSSDEQRVWLDQIQALMAVVEGHGNYVMDAVGAQVIPSFKRMRAAFDGRRKQASAVQRVINNVLGLEMKLRQYEVGQEFLERIVAREGGDVLAHLWADPSHLPTLQELRAPELWLTRVA
jgi:coenzyme F420 biosynthesis associated uncharacterized protein